MCEYLLILLIAGDYNSMIYTNILNIIHTFINLQLLPPPANIIQIPLHAKNRSDNTHNHTEHLQYRIDNHGHTEHLISVGIVQGSQYHEEPVEDVQGRDEEFPFVATGVILFVHCYCDTVLGIFCIFVIIYFFSDDIISVFLNLYIYTIVKLLNY